MAKEYRIHCKDCDSSFTVTFGGISIGVMNKYYCHDCKKISSHTILNKKPPIPPEPHWDEERFLRSKALRNCNFKEEEILDFQKNIMSWVRGVIDSPLEHKDLLLEKYKEMLERQKKKKLEYQKKLDAYNEQIKRSKFYESCKYCQSKNYSQFTTTNCVVCDSNNIDCKSTLKIID